MRDDPVNQQQQQQRWIRAAARGAIGAIAPLALMGCGWVGALGGQPNPAEIGPLLTEAATADGQTVVVRGTVRDRVPLLQGEVYRLEDDTGSLWILNPNSTNPADAVNLNDVVMVEGQVRYAQIPVSDRNFDELYAIEQRRLEHNRAP
jgi:hypothetical protein